MAHKANVDHWFMENVYARQIGYGVYLKSIFGTEEQRFIWIVFPFMEQKLIIIQLIHCFIYTRETMFCVLW